MIRLSGTAKLRVDYSVDLDMTEEEWDGLTTKQQDKILDEAIDWQEAYRSAELDDVDVDELEEIQA